jgi:hypothetical protein
MLHLERKLQLTGNQQITVICLDRHLLVLQDPPFNVCIKWAFFCMVNEYNCIEMGTVPSIIDVAIIILGYDMAF